MPRPRAVFVQSEAFSTQWGGGCQAAVAAHAVIQGDRVELRAVSYLGARPQRDGGESSVNEAERLGAEVAARLLKQIVNAG